MKVQQRLKQLIRERRVTYAELSEQWRRAAGRRKARSVPSEVQQFFLRQHLKAAAKEFFLTATEGPKPRFSLRSVFTSITMKNLVERALSAKADWTKLMEHEEDELARTRPTKRTQ